MEQSGSKRRVVQSSQAAVAVWLPGCPLSDRDSLRSRLQILLSLVLKIDCSCSGCCAVLAVRRSTRGRVCCERGQSEARALEVEFELSALAPRLASLSLQKKIWALDSSSTNTDLCRGSPGVLRGCRSSAAAVRQLMEPPVPLPWCQFPVDRSQSNPAAFPGSLNSS
jgi:hypothetical protein